MYNESTQNLGNIEAAKKLLDVSENNKNDNKLNAIEIKSDSVFEIEDSAHFSDPIGSQELKSKNSTDKSKTTTIKNNNE